jgi:hypothetical protein
MEIIKKQLTKLLDLVEKYPVKMPLSVVAEFLGMNEEGLKAGLMRGNIPFGFAYQKDDGGYRVNVIPTVKFYLWYTNTNGMMIMQGDM